MLILNYFCEIFYFDQNNWSSLSVMHPKCTKLHYPRSFPSSQLPFDSVTLFSRIYQFLQSIWFTYWWSFITEFSDFCLNNLFVDLIWMSSCRGFNFPTGFFRGHFYLLHITYVNSLNSNVPYAKFHFYADDTVLYRADLSPHNTLNWLQVNLKLVLNANKLKMFSNVKC